MGIRTYEHFADCEWEMSSRKNIDISWAANNEPLRKAAAAGSTKNASHSFNPVNWWKSVICYLLLEKQCDERAVNPKHIESCHWVYWESIDGKIFLKVISLWRASGCVALVGRVSDLIWLINFVVETSFIAFGSWCTTADKSLRILRLNYAFGKFIVLLDVSVTVDIINMLIRFNLLSIHHN